MSKQYEVTNTDYIHFLAAADCDEACVKAADCYLKAGIVVSHDKFIRFLTGQFLTRETLWTEIAPYIEQRNGYLVLDDTVIDNINSEKIKTTL